MHAVFARFFALDRYKILVLHREWCNFFFLGIGLEKGLVFRANIEPDSQDVFLHVRLIRTLPYFEILLSATCKKRVPSGENSGNTGAFFLPRSICGDGTLFAFASFY